MGQLVHHRLGNLITRTAPDINDFVVAFANGHQTRGVLLFNLFYLCLCRLDQAVLLSRNQHVIDANRNTCTRSQAETGLHKLIGKNNGIFQSATTEAFVDQLRDFFLL